MQRQFARRGRLRLAAAVVILGAWATGIGFLVQREYFQGRPERLAEAALRLNPGVTWFEMVGDGRVVGFASTTIDTLPTEVTAVEYRVEDPPSEGAGQRTTTRSVVKLSRGLALRSFDTQTDSPTALVHTGGRAEGDSAFVFVKDAGTPQTDSQRIAVHGQVVLPAMVPLVTAFGESPKVGRSFSLPTLDPLTMTAGTTRFTVTAESLFTVVDSAKFNETLGEWQSALTDTVRAWRVQSVRPDGSAANGANGGTDGGAHEWVDAQGRVVQSVLPGGITLRRTAYELAFENWRIAHERIRAAHAGPGNIAEETAIAASAAPGRTRLTSMTLVLRAPDLARLNLDGDNQRRNGDTLRVERERDADVGARAAGAPEMNSPAFRERFRAELSAEPLLQVHDPAIIRLALRIVGLERDPVAMARKLNRWLADSMVKAVSPGVPNAAALARSLKGDCDEHTQLYVALARALGIPARFDAGLLYAGGKFYRHSWPDVWLGEWTAVDPTFGEFPADAAHVRFVVGGLARQTELVQLLGTLKISVLEAR